MTEDGFRAAALAWLERTRQTPAALSRRAEIDKSLLSKYLHEDPARRVRPTRRNLTKLAAAMDLTYEQLLREMGELPSTPRAQVSARRQAVRDQLDRWLSAVGPENEQAFWDFLKAQGDSTVALIKDLGTAVNAVGDTAVNGAVSASGAVRKPRGGSAGGPLRRAQRPANCALAAPGQTRTRRRRRLTDARPSPVERR